MSARGAAGAVICSLATVGCAGAGAVEPLAVDPPSTEPSASAERADGVVWEERFERMPAHWHSMSGASDRDIARVFSIGRESDQSFLRAAHRASGQDPPPAIHFGRSWSERPLRLVDACLLSWRWRVLRHPRSAADPWKDLAASVYVITDPPGIFSRGRGFKLGWLARPGPEGTQQRGLLQVAVRVGPAGQRWHDEEVDLCALFRAHFGPVSDEPLGYVGVVTDADDSASVAEADYDDLVLRDRPSDR